MTRSKPRSQRRERNPAAKLTAYEVSAIRALYQRLPHKGRKWTQTRLAEAFGVSQSEISNVIRWDKWRELP